MTLAQFRILLLALVLVPVVACSIRPPVEPAVVNLASEQVVPNPSTGDVGVRRDDAALPQANKTHSRPMTFCGQPVADDDTNNAELFCSSANPVELDGLRWFPQLARLVLHTPVVSLEPIRGLTGLRILHVVGTGALLDLSPLANLTSLKELRLFMVTIPDLGPLEQLSNLTSLTIGGSDVAPDVRPLQRHRKLVELSISSVPLEDAQLAHLSVMFRLRKLDLDGTQVTDRGLLHLRQLTQLRELSVRETRVTDGGVLTLQRALPKLVVHR